MSGTITGWLDRVRHGDSSAVEHLWQYFSPTMLRRLAPQCRQLRAVDEEDIVSVAFYKLTAAMIEDKAEGITNRKEFWRLLRIITKRKLNDSLRYENAKKRGGDHTVVSLDCIPDTVQPAPADSKGSNLDDDSLMQMLQQVAERMHRKEFAKIIEHKVQGMTNSEVARNLGISLRTTQYLIQDIKDAWIETFKDDA